MYTQRHMWHRYVNCRRKTYLQLIGKIAFYQVTVYQNKIGICAFCLYRSNLCHFKKMYIFICIKTCHMMKIVRKQLALRIMEHQLFSYVYRIAAFYEILHSNIYVVTQACLRIFFINNNTQQKNHVSRLALCTFMR